MLGRLTFTCFTVLACGSLSCKAGVSPRAPLQPPPLAASSRRVLWTHALDGGAERWTFHASVVRVDVALPVNTTLLPFEELASDFLSVSCVDSGGQESRFSPTHSVSVTEPVDGTSAPPLPTHALVHVSVGGEGCSSAAAQAASLDGMLGHPHYRRSRDAWLLEMSLRTAALAISTQCSEPASVSVHAVILDRVDVAIDGRSRPIANISFVAIDSDAHTSGSQHEMRARRQWVRRAATSSVSEPLESLAGDSGHCWMRFKSPRQRTSSQMTPHERIRDASDRMRRAGTDVVAQGMPFIGVSSNATSIVGDRLEHAATLGPASFAAPSSSYKGTAQWLRNTLPAPALRGCPALVSRHDECAVLPARGWAGEACSPLHWAPCFSAARTGGLISPRCGHSEFINTRVDSRTTSVSVLVGSVPLVRLAPMGALQGWLPVNNAAAPDPPPRAWFVRLLDALLGPDSTTTEPSGRSGAFVLLRRRSDPAETSALHAKLRHSPTVLLESGSHYAGRDVAREPPIESYGLRDDGAGAGHRTVNEDLQGRLQSGTRSRGDERVSPVAADSLATAAALDKSAAGFSHSNAGNEGAGDLPAAQRNSGRGGRASVRGDGSRNGVPDASGSGYAVVHPIPRRSSGNSQSLAPATAVGAKAGETATIPVEAAAQGSDVSTAAEAEGGESVNRSGSRDERGASGAPDSAVVSELAGPAGQEGSSDVTSGRQSGGTADGGSGDGGDKPELARKPELDPLAVVQSILDEIVSRLHVA